MTLFCLCTTTKCLVPVPFFSVADPNFFHPGSASKNLSILTQEIVVHPGSDPDILPIPDPRSRGQKDTGSRILDPQHCLLYLTVTVVLMILCVTNARVCRPADWQAAEQAEPAVQQPADACGGELSCLLRALGHRPPPSCCCP